jgi:hypothetical protein
MHLWGAEMGQSDRDHLLARAERERDLALEASTKLVRDIHLQLAQEYDLRANIQRAPRAENDSPGMPTSH